MSVKVRATIIDLIVFSADTDFCGLSDAEAIEQLWIIAQRAPAGSMVTLTIERQGCPRWTLYGNVDRHT